MLQVRDFNTSYFKSEIALKKLLLAYDNWLEFTGVLNIMFFTVKA